MNIENIKTEWDLIVIGGGITAAGIFREAVRLGIRVLLLEQNDFAWGTSSRSSKLVHGGLRYLKQGKIFLTKASVEERQRLLKEAEGLVEPVDFLMPIYEDKGPGRWLIEAGLSIYDLLAFNRQHRFYPKDEFLMMAPHLNQDRLVGGFKFSDAKVDDARLVLRLIKEAVSEGGSALNYTKATSIVRQKNGFVTGVEAVDTETGKEKFLSSRAVINATGSWAETLHPSPDSRLHLRPLRGSHLIFPSWAVPIAQAISFVHPADQRPIFAVPWEGAILFGTTDVDHKNGLLREPAISNHEISYLMEALHYYFPSVSATIENSLSSLAGVRPVLSKGNTDPSKESREHVVWTDKGLVTITGGKLTTFRRLAWDALKSAKSFLPSSVHVKDRGASVFSKPADSVDLIHEKEYKRLCGRYGMAAKNLVLSASSKNLEKIPGTETIWAELPHAAANEQIRHLSDLMLRRVRIGLLTPEGGKEHLPKIKELCTPVLSWDEDRWNKEIQEYLLHWKQYYSRSDSR